MPKRILVTNDSPELLRMLQALLEEEGYEVLPRGTPFREIAEIEALHPDLIMLNLIAHTDSMGRQILEMLNLEQTTASLPLVILFTEREYIEKRNRYLMNKAIFLVRKPFDIDTLLDAIQQALNPSSPRQAVSPIDPSQ